jgi:hypothetical protein
MYSHQAKEQYEERLAVIEAQMGGCEAEAS